MADGHLLPLFAFLVGGAVIFVESVLLNIVNDRRGNEIADTHLTAQEQSDFGAAYVVLNELLDDVDVVLPRLETG